MVEKPTSAEIKEDSTKSASGETTNKQPKKRNRNRKKKTNSSAAATETTNSGSKKPAEEGVKKGGVVKAKAVVAQKKTPRKFREKIKELDKRDATHISENRLRALGINPKKYQNKLKYGGKD